jgi:hypothetical protein
MSKSIPKMGDCLTAFDMGLLAASRIQPPMNVTLEGREQFFAGLVAGLEVKLGLCRK